MLHGTSRKFKLLLDSLADVCNFLQNVLDDQHDFLHHIYLIHQTLFPSILKKNPPTKKKGDTDETHCMSNVGQGRQRAVYRCAIMCDLSIEWPIMSKHCTSSDDAFEDETDSALRSCYVDGCEISAFVHHVQ